MTLQLSEIQRIKAELGFNQLTLGAIPYVQITQYFEQIVLPDLESDALTTSSTAVTAAATPTAVALTLASPAGFAMFNRVVVDVDENQEMAQIQSVTGSAITLFLTLAHTGTYPVEIECGETMVRDYLRKLRSVAIAIEKVPSRAGVKRVGDISLETNRNQSTQLDTLLATQRKWREELSLLLFGVGSLQQWGGAGARLSVY